MIFAGTTKTALGIDVSDKRISLVLLKQSRKGIELVRTAESPVPADAVKGGNIVDAAALAGTIEQMKHKIRARSAKAAISLFARPVLLQIIDMPKGLPTNVRQFIGNEIKQCVVLPVKKAAFDFCGMDAGKKSYDTRLFVAAADSERIAALGRSYGRGSLNIEVIEPVLLACARALYSKKIAGKFDTNVLIVMLHNNVLTLCVFKNQVIDFIRSKAMEEYADGAGLCRWLAGQINEIIQFYDAEVADAGGRWEITIVSESVELPADAKEILKGQVHCVALDVSTYQEGLRDTAIIGAEKSGAASLIAAGLAMRLLEGKDHGLKINLFPPEASEVKLLRTDFLIAANAAAAGALVLMLIGGYLAFLCRNTSQNILIKSSDARLQKTYDMISKRDTLNQRIKQLADRPSGLTKLLGLQQDVDWLNFLNDVRAATPKTVRITNLTQNAGNKVVLEGLALSYESTHLFVNMLNKSSYIAEASLAGTEKKSDTEGFVKYAINCVLVPKEQEKEK